MVLICLYNLIMNVGRMWGECGEECEDECGDQCGDSFTVVNFEEVILVLNNHKVEQPFLNTMLEFILT